MHHASRFALGSAVVLLLAACSSSDSSGGLDPDDRTLTDIQVAPAVATLAPGDSVQFTAQGLFSDGSTGAVQVGWSAAGGALRPSGYYVAGSATGTYPIVAATSGLLFVDTAFVTVATP